VGYYLDEFTVANKKVNRLQIQRKTKNEMLLIEDLFSPFHKKMSWKETENKIRSRKIKTALNNEAFGKSCSQSLK